MKKLALVLLLVMGLGVVSAGMVQATAITVGDPWYAFFAGLAGTPYHRFRRWGDKCL